MFGLKIATISISCNILFTFAWTLIAICSLYSSSRNWYIAVKCFFQCFSCVSGCKSPVIRDSKCLQVTLLNYFSSYCLPFCNFFFIYPFTQELCILIHLFLISLSTVAFTVSFNCFFQLFFQLFLSTDFFFLFRLLIDLSKRYYFYFTNLPLHFCFAVPGLGQAQCLHGVYYLFCSTITKIKIAIPIDAMNNSEISMHWKTLMPEFVVFCASIFVIICPFVFGMFFSSLLLENNDEIPFATNVPRKALPVLGAINAPFINIFFFESLFNLFWFFCRISPYIISKASETYLWLLKTYSYIWLMCSESVLLRRPAIVSSESGVIFNCK